ncbi:MFS transporter [Streptomyces sp. JW3]|uniref:MFS transporter n=1 Tax=Streptomyces sp. JW3 TaxID=3456955 RepID=UPI003FA47C4D
MPTNSYRELVRTPSVGRLMSTSILARLNQGMSGLALMMITTERSTYAVYSLVSAASVIGLLVSGPLASRLADTHGRRRVLTVTAVLHTLAMGGMTVCPPRPALLVVLSLLTGLCTPPMTAAVRAALPELVRPHQRRTFFALEATAQEVILVVGPVITSTLAVLGGPRLALGGCAGLVLVGTLAYVGDRNVEAGRAPAGTGSRAGAWRTPGLPRLCAVGFLLTGALAAQVMGIVALVSGRHVTSGAGLILACGSFGSLVGGLIHGARKHHHARLRPLMLVLAAGLLVLPLTPGTGVLTVAFFLLGMTVAPLMSALFERLSWQVPAGMVAEAFGWMGSAFAVGNVSGSALGGVLITAYGAAAPFGAACALALVAALICEPWSGGVRDAATE